MKLAIFGLLWLISSVSSYTIKRYTCEWNEEGDEKFVYPNHSCGFSKTNSASFPVMTCYAVFRSLVDTMWISFSVEKKVNNRFQTFFEIPQIDYCKEIDGILKGSDSFFKLVYRVGKYVAPGIIHECPYMGFFMTNFSIDTRYIPSKYLHAEYRAILTHYEAKNGPMMGVTKLVVSIDDE